MSRQLLENRFLTVIKHHLFTDEGIELFRKEMARIIADKQKQKYSGVGQLRSRLMATESEIANIMNAIKAGIVAPTILSELKKAEAEKAELSRQLQHNTHGVDNVAVLLPRAVDRFRKMVNDFENVSQREVNQIRTKISALIGGQIILNPDDDGHLNANIQGDYLGLLQAIDIKGKISLVAGAGFGSSFNQPIRIALLTDRQRRKLERQGAAQAPKHPPHKSADSPAAHTAAAA